MFYVLILSMCSNLLISQINKLILQLFINDNNIIVPKFDLLRTNHELLRHYVVVVRDTNNIV